MGQKINPIALRLGGRIIWWNNSKKTLDKKYDLKKEFYLLRQINRISNSIFKSYGILNSELIFNTKKLINIKNKNTKILWNKINNFDLDKKELFNINYFLKKDLYSIFNNHFYKNKSILYVKGLIFKPQIEFSIIRENKTNWNYLKELIKYGRNQSKRTYLLLKEINVLIEEIIKNTEKDKIDIKIDFQLIKSPIYNSSILSDWIELTLLENTRITNDKKVFKLLFDTK